MSDKTETKLDLKWKLPLSVEPYSGTMIFDADNHHIADIRGWGYLTGVGGLHLPDVEAVKIQDARTKYLVDAVNSYARTASPWTAVEDELPEDEGYYWITVYTNEATDPHVEMDYFDGEVFNGESGRNFRGCLTVAYKYANYPEPHRRDDEQN